MKQASRYGKFSAAVAAPRPPPLHRWYATTSPPSSACGGEKRGENEPQTSALSAALGGRLLQPYPCSSPVLIDELDASALEGSLDLAPRLYPTAQKSILSLQPFDRRDRDICSQSELFLRPPQKRACSFDLSN